MYTRSLYCRNARVLDRLATHETLFLPQNLEPRLTYFTEITAGTTAGFADGNPMLHLWSLGVEEQFYIIWPLVVTLGIKLKSGGARRTLALYVLILIASFVANISVAFLSGGESGVDAAYYSPFTRFWELVIGAILAWCHEHDASALVDVSEQANIAG